MKTIIRRAYLNCSIIDYLQEELDHIVYVFEKFNNYPKWVSKQLLEEVKYNYHGTSHKVMQINEVNNDTLLGNKLQDNIVTTSAYSIVRLKYKFNIKTKIEKEHQHGVTYYVECPEKITMTTM